MRTTSSGTTGSSTPSTERGSVDSRSTVRRSRWKLPGIDSVRSLWSSPSFGARRPTERDRKIESLAAELRVGPPEVGVWDKLRWDEVREMARGGIDFGAHTLDHPILKYVSAEEARRQIRGSRERIEQELGTRVTTFAYPNGRAEDFDESTKRILKEEGFTCAVTTVGGANDASTDPFALRRVGMWDEDPGLSVLRLAWSRRS